MPLLLQWKSKGKHGPTQLAPGEVVVGEQFTPRTGLWICSRAWCWGWLIVNLLPLSVLCICFTVLLCMHNTESIVLVCSPPMTFDGLQHLCLLPNELQVNSEAPTAFASLMFLFSSIQ